MTDSHNRSHDHSDKAVSRLWITLFLNLGITIAQLIGGVISNSMALISDAVHNLSDTGSIGVSLIARTFANKKADKQMTFGYRRADIIGAFINLIILVAVSLFLIKEGVERFLHPEEIDGTVMFWVALLGLTGNVLSVFILHADSKKSLNIKSAYIHVWKIDENKKMLECHTQIDEAQSRNLEEIKSDLKTCLSERFGITHSAIEFELTPCEKPSHHS